MPHQLENALAIKGWMSTRELMWLAQQARKSQIIIEVGCYLGRTTKALADNTAGVIYSVDPWEKFYPDNDGNKHPIEPDVYNNFEQNLLKEIREYKVYPVRTRFHEHLKLPKADFIFLDGDHRYATVMHDIAVAEKFIAPGGVIAGHDYTHTDWPGVRKAVDEYYSLVELVESIWIRKY